MNRPRQLPDLVPIANCWWTFYAMRGLTIALGGGVSAFPLTLGEYFDAHCVPLEARPRWIRLLACMDATYKEVLAAKRPPAIEEGSDDAKP